MSAPGPNPILTGDVVAQLRVAAAGAAQPYATYYRALIGYAEECDRLAKALAVEHDEARRGPLVEKYQLHAQLFHDRRDEWFGTKAEPGATTRGPRTL